MKFAFKNVSIAKKFSIIGMGFLAASFFSIVGMIEISKTTELQKLERDHIEFTTLLYFKAEKYVGFLKENQTDSLMKAEKLLNVRSEDNKEKGIIQLMEELRRLQDTVFVVANPAEQTLFRWVGFGRAFELAGNYGPQTIRNMRKFLSELDKKEITPEQFEKNFQNEVLTLSGYSNEFTPIVNHAGIFVRNLMITLTVIFVIIGIAILILALVPMNASIKYFTTVAKIIADGDLGKEIEINQKDEIGQLADAFRDMMSKIEHVAMEIRALTQQVSEGKLKARGNAEEFKGGWRELITGLNALIDAFVLPIHVTATYIDHISKGDIPAKITDHYKGDFNEIKNNLNACIDVVNGLVAETVMLTENAAQGNLSVRGSADKFGGGYARIVNGINDTLDAVIGPLNVAAQYVFRISQGDFPDIITDQYKGDFNEIKVNINRLISNLQATVQVAEKIADGDLSAQVNILSEKDMLGKSLAKMVKTIQEIVSDINRLTTAASEGKLDVRGDAGRFGGEYAKIIRGVNDTIDAVVGPLNVTADYVERISKGEIPEKISDDYKGDFNTTRNNLNMMIEKLSLFGSHVQQTAERMASGSEELSSAAAQVSQGTSQQAASIEEVSSSMEEISTMVTQNAENAKQSSEIAIKTAKYAIEGKKAVDETVRAMKSISDKIRIIEEIARQTNMLALNAAIEAARASEHGKGFAVVAAEVRKLAERSQSAAKEINLLSEANVEIAENAIHLLEEMVSGIQKTADSVEEIKDASAEQADGIRQVNQAIQQLDMVIQQNASSAEEMASSSRDFSSQADQLLQIASFFKLSQSAKSSAQVVSGKISVIPKDKKISDGDDFQRY
ncbi:MAG TPA: methyl-accepting chemotaxis protein [Desulfobacteraceae bacterium]|nr:methyl-accepting chemotaxis protein [Desulfobacteraceae bacterium]